VKLWKKSAIFSVALLATGLARIPFEKSLTRELRETGLLTAPVAVGTLDKIGQTSSAVALGGLRTLVATFLNLRAFTYFTEQRWDDLRDTFDTIVDLAPRTRYYWETASWHLAYNAASYYQQDSDLPPLRRREAWRSSIFQGREFLERAIRNNPDDWSLQSNLGFLLSDSNKFQAFPDREATFAAAAEAYKAAAKTGEAPSFVRRAQLYSLARIPGREKEALDLAETLYREARLNHTPTLLSLLFVLRMHADPTQNASALARNIFGTDQRAYDNLSLHWMRQKEMLPVDGVAAALQSLETGLGIPPEKSVFSTTAVPADDLSK